MDARGAASTTQAAQGQSQMISRPTGLGHASEEEHLEARVCDERWRAAWRRSAWCTAAGGTSSGWSCSNRDGHVISHVHHAKEACEPRMLMIVRSTSVRVPCGVASVAQLVPVSVPGTCTPASGSGMACQHFLLASFTRTKTAAMTLGQVLERIMARAASGPGRGCRGAAGDGFLGNRVPTRAPVRRRPQAA